MVAKKFPKLKLSFLVGESSKDEVELPMAEADLPNATIEPTELVPMLTEESTLTMATQSSSIAPLEV